MDYLQSLLLRDGHSIASFDDGREAGKSRSAGDGEIRRLLESLTIEADSVATFVAVSGSIVNALAKPVATRAVSAQALKTYVTPEMPIAALAMARMIASDELSGLAMGYQTYEARISLARRMALAYADETSLQPSHRTVELSTLQNAWSHACTSALSLITTLRYISGRDNRQASQKVPDLLAETASGGTPCIEPDGCIVIPGWAERRADPRQSIDFQVGLRAGATFGSARAVDVSSYGLGLSEVLFETTASILPGDSVRVKLPDGRILTGEFAWIAGSKAGITLAQPLAADDPIWRL